MAANKPLLGENEVLLYDTINSFYCGVARIALCENGIQFKSHYLSMPSQEHTVPWFARINPKMMLPTLVPSSGAAVTESRDIVSFAYGGRPGIAAEEQILDRLYSEDVGSLAWLTGREKILLLKVVLKIGLQKKMIPKILHKRQKEAPDLFDVYERKIEALSNKHFSKRIEDVAHHVGEVVSFLERTLLQNGGFWLLGLEFGRADAVATAWLQWVVRCNEYGAAPVVIPQSLQDYLERARARPAYQRAIGQYGKDAFVLHTFTKKSRMASFVLAAVVAIASLLALWYKGLL